MIAPDSAGAADLDPAGAAPDQERALHPRIVRMVDRVVHWWALAAVLLLLLATAFLVPTLRGQQNSGSPQAATDNHGLGTVPLPSARERSPEVPQRRGADEPVALRIPAIRVDASLTTLGLNPDQTVEVPTDFGKPGWYKFGPTPGHPGSAVILGHVDSHQGPAIFYQLKKLHAGDSVDVSMTDGRVAHFAVTKVETYLKTEFPAEQVYGSHGGESLLQLVTCGGEFDADAHSYRSNVVAYTSLVQTTRGAS